MLVDGARSSRTCARFDLAEYVDLQQTRPTVSLVDGETRKIHWPTIELVAGVAGRDVLVVTGPEPSVRWKVVTDELVAFAASAGVQRGGPARRDARAGVAPPADRGARHRRRRRSVAQEIGALRADYVGPTGIQSVLQVALGEAGIRAVGLWAQVPHYVAGTPSPPAIRALLERLHELAGSTVDLRGLDEQIDSYLEQVESGLSRPARRRRRSSTPARGRQPDPERGCPRATTSPARSSGSSATRADAPGSAEVRAARLGPSRMSEAS